MIEVGLVSAERVKAELTGWAGKPRDQQEKQGPLAFCAHRFADCKAELWCDLTRSYGGMCLEASLEGRRVGMITFLPKRVARRLGIASSPDDRDLDATLVAACLVVLPGWRGRGVAKALVAGLVEHARRLGYRRVEGATAGDEVTPEGRYGWQSAGPFAANGFALVEGAGAPWLPVVMARQV